MFNRWLSYTVTIQGFPQVLQTWGGAPQNLMGGLKSKNGGAWGSLKCCRKIPLKEFI